MNRKDSHNELLYILDLLSSKRAELLTPFLESKSNEWTNYSFIYEKKQIAFDLVRNCYTTLWIDKHFEQLNTDDQPNSVKKKALTLLSEFLHMKSSELDEAQLKHELLTSKLKTIKELLNYEDISTIQMNEFKYAQVKDKALFEREFEKYENEMLKNDAKD